MPRSHKKRNSIRHQGLNRNLLHRWKRELHVEKIYSTRFGVRPRAIAEPPIVYSRINAQPTNHAALQDNMFKS
jgi:hypothetical protein